MQQRVGRVKRVKEENDEKTKKMDRCQKFKYGYKGLFQRCFFSYILDCLTPLL